ncbi:MAG: hypothetical protein ACR2H3_12150 [Acidimicrobiales bacterium]
MDEIGRRFAAGQSPFEGPILDREGAIRIPDAVAPTTDKLDRVSWLVQGVIGTLPG